MFMCQLIKMCFLIFLTSTHVLLMISELYCKTQLLALLCVCGTCHSFLLYDRLVFWPIGPKRLTKPYVKNPTSNFYK